MGKSVDGMAITPYLHSWAYEQGKHKKATKYIAQFGDKKTEVHADNEREAQQLAAHYFRCKFPHKVLVMVDRYYKNHSGDTA